MKDQRNNRLITKVLIIGVLIAVLSYLFHPGAGQLSMMINGEPVADPLVHFAAIPTLLAVIFITGILTLLLFFGVGILMFLAALIFAMLGIGLVAPYFWPILLIIFLITALMVLINSNKD
ncbi:MAG: hypothetical protein ACXW0H_02555 [Methylobacter sp.]